MDPSDPSKNQQAPSNSWQSSSWQPSAIGATPPYPAGRVGFGGSTNGASGAAVNFDSFFDSLFAVVPGTSGGGGASLGMLNPALFASNNIAPLGTSQSHGGTPNVNSSINYNDGKTTMKTTKKKAAGKPKVEPLPLVNPVGNSRIDAVIDIVAKGLATSSSARTQVLATPLAAATATSSAPVVAGTSSMPNTYFNLPVAATPLPVSSTSSMVEPKPPPKTKAKKRSAPAPTSNSTLPSPAAANPFINAPQLSTFLAASSSATPAVVSNYRARLPKKPPAKWKNPNSNVSHSSSIVQVQPPPLVSAEPSMPPDWQTYYDQTYASLSTHQTFPVDPTSQEFLIIKELLNPTTVISAEKIVNPDLWQRYVNTRKDMLKAKTDDLSILSKLGLDEREVLRSAHVSFNYTKDPLLSTESARYSPNETLLFHCTRSKENLTKILSQGLDERLSSLSGGLLGKGIYFADDPQKSVQYDGGTGTILIFAVLLGDCVSVDHLANQNSLVREPEKEKEQRRNFNDQFFDSITARPAGHNEYVIYNRYQCCPLYQIKYQRKLSAHTSSEFSVARQEIPTVAWRNIPGTRLSMPNQALNGGWPFFAPSLFKRMGVLPPLSNDDDQFEPYTIDSNGIIVVKADDDSDDTKEKLATLSNLGLFDEERNKEILLKFGNNLEQAVNFLLDDQNQPEPQPRPQVSSSTSNGVPTGNKIAATATVNLSSDSDSADDANIKRAKIVTADLPEDLANWALEFDADLLQQSQPTTLSSPPEKEECPICCNEYDAFSHSSYLWKALQCSHRLCYTCYRTIQNSGTTMSGVHHVSVKCPFCQGITGTEVGTCPDGQMTVNTIASACAGYAGKNTIQLNYFINSGQHQLNRTAYLPDTPEGNKVLQLLRTAWDRRLCFTIGTSITTGAQNVLVWNIHHKTAISGGVQSHGYPDPGYLERVKWELKAYGIE